MNLFVISDTHFSHSNIITYCNRPFASAEEMDEAMIARWNERVRTCDHVYHLGDVAMSLAAMDAIMPRLNGHLRLVRGNHDIFKTKRYLKWFDEIYGVRVYDNVAMTHIPMHSGSMGRFAANVHGHIHQNLVTPAVHVSTLVHDGVNIEQVQSYINVSVEHTDYAPLEWSEVKKRIAQARQ